MLKGNRRLASIIAGLLTIGAIVLVPGVSGMEVHSESQTNAITAIVAMVGASQALIRDDDPSGA